MAELITTSCFIVGKKHLSLDDISSTSSKLSTNDLQLILERLRANQNRDSTAKNYYSIWKHLNKFLTWLDSIPESWEERIALFFAYLVDYHKVQSATMRSYLSAFKHILKTDGYQWSDEKIWFNALMRSCKLVNDTVKTRFPIHIGLLETILFEMEREFHRTSQNYLETLYKALFTLAYYSLMRIRELTQSQHVIKAKDIHIAENKDKIRILLYSSKTHSKESRPQEIQISAHESTGHRICFFCPFMQLRNYLNVR